MRPSRPLLANQRKHRRQAGVSAEPATKPKSHGMRPYALSILALLPLSFGAWALSIVLPTAYEAWRASEEIFQPRAERARFADDAPAAPTVMPDSVKAVLTATAQGTEVAALPATASPASDEADSTPTATEPMPPRGTPEPAGGPLDAATPESTPTDAGPTPTPYPEWDGDDPVHILLLGVDTRPSEETAGRSDTIIVVRVDPADKRVDMFSIPRDLAVNIPGFSSGAKINSAYPWGEMYDIEGGGPSLVAQTIEYNFGITIDYYATVDIPGLERIVDTLGGVIVDVKTQLKDDQYPTEDFGYTRAYFPPGLQKLDGKQAVQFARTRHSDGDFMRSQRQQQLLLAIRDQALESGIITKLPQLIGDMRETLRTDLSLSKVYSLARLAQEIPRENIWVHSLAPYTYASETSEGWFLIGDWDALRWVVQNLEEHPLASNIPGG